MVSFPSDQRRQRLRRFAHFFSGLLILLHGFERYDSGHAMWPVFLLSGLIFMMLAFFHASLARIWSGIDGVSFVIEALLSFIIMVEFIQMGKRGLPFMYLFAGSAQLCAGWITWRKRRLKKRRSV